MILTDDSIMPFGKYAKSETRMEDIPAAYLLWLWEQYKGQKPFGEGPQAVNHYIIDNLAGLEKEDADPVKKRSYKE